MPMQIQWPPPRKIAHTIVQAVARNVVRAPAESHKPTEAKHAAGANQAMACRKSAIGFAPPKTSATSQTEPSHQRNPRTLQRDPSHLAVMISRVVKVVVMRLTSVSRSRSA